MQDVDYELVYEPGKDEADPMDYLSSIPELPEYGDPKLGAENGLVCSFSQLRVFAL